MLLRFLPLFFALMLLPATAEDRSAASPVSYLQPTCAKAIRSLPKKIDVNENWGIASLDGRWKHVSKKTFGFTTVTINSVRMLCGKLERKCDEYIAYVYSKHLDGDRMGYEDGELGSIHNEYKIREWSNERIIAVKEMPVAVLEIRILLGSNTADQIYREREDPNVFSQFILE